MKFCMRKAQPDVGGVASGGAAFKLVGHSQPKPIGAAELLFCATSSDEGLAKRCGQKGISRAT